MFDPHSVEECKNAILNICSADLSAYGAYNSKKATEFSLESVGKEMHRIYFGE